MGRKSAKMTPIQVQMLVDILYENSEITTSKLTTGFTREERNNKWEAVATLLNSKDLGPQKTAEQWRKSWTDLKCTTRSKAAKMELVGGTDMLNQKLTNLEKRILQLTGDITPVLSSEGETKILTGKLWLKKLEDDLIKSEADLIRVMKKPNRLALPPSFSRIIDLPKETVTIPIVENVGGKEKTDQKDDNDKGDNDKGDDDKSDNDKGDDDDNDDECINVSADCSDDDIIYDDSDVNEEIFDNNIKEPLTPPAKKRRTSSVDKTSVSSTESKSFISVFQKQIETQTAVLKEQTNIMKDIAKSLRLIASALHDR